MNLWEAAVVVWCVGCVWSLSLGVNTVSKVLLWPCYLVVVIARDIRNW